MWAHTKPDYGFLEAVGAELSKGSDRREVTSPRASANKSLDDRWGVTFQSLHKSLDIKLTESEKMEMEELKRAV